MAEEKEEQEMKQVQLDVGITYKQVDYAPGVNTVTKEVADLIVKRKFGHIIGDAPNGSGVDFEEIEKEASRTEETPFEPLPLDETMKRFQDSDWSDVVMKSMQFHKPAIDKQRENQQAEWENQRAESLRKNSGQGEGQNDQQPAPNEKDDDKTNTAPKENDPTDSSQLPKDFPQRHIFVKLGFNTVEEIQSLPLEKLIELDGIAEPSAQKALAYGKK